MRVLVDAPIWSLALRRRTGDRSPDEEALVAEWRVLVEERQGLLLGPVRQEVLTGIRDGVLFDRLRQALAAFPDQPILPADYVEAARCFNRCRAKGIAGTDIDLLLCAVSLRLGCPIFTTDGDFARYARVLPIRLHRPR